MRNASTQKSVTIEIAKKDLATLKQGGYALCFAKKTNNTYNVVWSSSTQYLHSNTFSWTPEYTLFGTNTFKDGLLVTASTNEVPIGLGMTSILDTDGNLGDPTTGGPDTAITMVNDYGDIHPAVSALSTDIDGNTTTTPIYVAPSAAVKGAVFLTPIETVMVWFQQNIQTSTMFSDARSRSTEIDLTSVDQATRLYQNEIWSTPPARAVALPPFVIIVATLTGAVVVQNIASKISAKLTGVYGSFSVEVKAGPNNQVTIAYNEKPGLADATSWLAQRVAQEPTTGDALAQFTLEAFALLGLGYTSFDAKTSNDDDGSRKPVEADRGGRRLSR